MAKRTKKQMLKLYKDRLNDVEYDRERVWGDLPALVKKSKKYKRKIKEIEEW